MNPEETLSSSFLAKQYQDFHRFSVTQFVESVAPSVKAGATIVDAGAGEGWYKHLFGHARYIALDYAVGDAAWDYSKIDVVCDLHAVPLKSSSIPYILCTQTLEHVQRPYIVLSELYRVLAHEGMLFCSLPFIGDAHHQEPYDYYRYTRYAVEYLFRDAGFKSMKIEPIGGYNTLLVSLIQKGVMRYAERHTGRSKVITVSVVFIERLLFLVLRWANKVAWIRDQKDANRYRYALGFTVVAKK